MISRRRSLGQGRGVPAYRHDDIGESVSLTHVTGVATSLYNIQYKLLLSLNLWMVTFALIKMSSYDLHVGSKRNNISRCV